MKPQYLQEYVMLPYKEAISGEDKGKWLKDLEEEKSSLKKYGVFQYVDGKKFQEIRSFEDDQGSVIKQKKSLYSLKQAAHAWNKRFVDFLKAHGLHQLITDMSVFVNDEGNLILAIWVDDGLVISNENDKIDEFMGKLQTEFEVKITDNPEIFVGLEIGNARGFINIHQESYVDQLLKTYNMGCTNLQFQVLKTLKTVMEWKAVGSLLYLSNRSRPDITYEVNMTSRKVENPTVHEVKKFKRVFWYLMEPETQDLDIRQISILR
ncbi:hypothetical protein PR048_004835 [Dryococelus australis]|uniref:Reverse transcriptase Ty1/copia-type domain-containing protein n=1 Tax=Dryococelus australis TaxID=614101 RepID=A0ABQ9I7M6_9NEOP|nr:hypothetical protein PR048_004835 [Dryococelus australis]